MLIYTLQILVDGLISIDIWNCIPIIIVSHSHIHLIIFITLTSLNICYTFYII